MHNSSISKQKPILKECMNIKLPKLNVAKIFGDIAKWLTFWSAFETAIHKNDILDSGDKFNYL